jgi:hypothetical protein
VPGSQANLSQLESYRVIIAWKLTGKTTDGKNVEEQTTYTQALHRPSNTSHTLVVENKPGAQGTRSEIYSVGDTLYIYEKDSGSMPACHDVRDGRYAAWHYRRDDHTASDR